MRQEEHIAGDAQELLILMFTRLPVPAPQTHERHAKLPWNPRGGSDGKRTLAPRSAQAGGERIWSSAAWQIQRTSLLDQLSTVGRTFGRQQQCRDCRRSRGREGGRTQEPQTSGRHDSAGSAEPAMEIERQKGAADLDYPALCEQYAGEQTHMGETYEHHKPLMADHSAVYAFGRFASLLAKGRNHRVTAGGTGMHKRGGGKVRHKRKTETPANGNNTQEASHLGERKTLGKKRDRHSSPLRSQQELN